MVKTLKVFNIVCIPTIWINYTFFKIYLFDEFKRVVLSLPSIERSKISFVVFFQRFQTTNSFNKAAFVMLPFSNLDSSSQRYYLLFIILKDYNDNVFPTFHLSLLNFRNTMTKNLYLQCNLFVHILCPHKSIMLRSWSNFNFELKISYFLRHTFVLARSPRTNRFEFYFAQLNTTIHFLQA